MNSVRRKLIEEIVENVRKEMGGNVQVGNWLMNSAPSGGAHLGAMDWGSLFSGLINTASTTYATKELQKTQANLANNLAEAQAKKLLAETELELAKAQTQAQQTALLQKQNELQKILKDIQFTDVQKWLLAGAGVLAFGLGVVQLMRFAEKGKRKK